MWWVACGHQLQKGAAMVSVAGRAASGHEHPAPDPTVVEGFYRRMRAVAPAAVGAIERDRADDPGRAFGDTACGRLVGSLEPDGVRALGMWVHHWCMRFYDDDTRAARRLLREIAARPTLGWTATRSTGCCVSRTRPARWPPTGSRCHSPQRVNSRHGCRPGRVAGHRASLHQPSGTDAATGSRRERQRGRSRVSRFPSQSSSELPPVACFDVQRSRRYETGS